MIKYEIIETEMYPNKWFGGPTFQGKIYDNSFIYYFETREEAEENVLKLMYKL